MTIPIGIIGCIFAFFCVSCISSADKTQIEQERAAERLRKKGADIRKVKRFAELSGAFSFDPQGTHWHLALWGSSVDDSDLPDMELIRPVARVHVASTKVRPRTKILRWILSNTETQVLTYNERNVTDETLVGIERLKELESLSLQGTGISNNTMSYLAKNVNLDSLDLRDTAISDEALKKLSELQLPRLQYLLLDQTHVTDAGMKFLAKMKPLKSITLGQTGVTDDAMRILADSDSIEGLVLAHTFVSDAGLEHCKRFKRVKTLSFAGLGITDKGLEHLEQLSTLVDLNLNGTKVTRAGKQKLHKALPKLSIVGVE